MSRAALLIGSDAYDDPDLAPLSAPLVDIERLAGLLRDPSIGFFDSVEVLLNRPSHELLLAIEDLSASCRPDDLLLLYVSCHGVVDYRPGGSQGLHFAAPNTRTGRLASTSVPARYVNEQLTQSLAHARVLLLDCCFSGRFAEGFGTKAAADPLREVAGGGYVVLTASDALGVAYEESWEQSSVFTGVIVDGLRTGDADRDGDGLVSTNDLFDYAAPHVQARHRQTPHYLAVGVDGKVILARRAGLAEQPSVGPSEQPYAGVTAGAWLPAGSGPRPADDAGRFVLGETDRQVAGATEGPAVPLAPLRDWTAAVTAVATALTAANPAASVDLRQWPVELFGGAGTAAAGMLAWRADLLPAAVTGLVDAAHPAYPSPSHLADAWRALGQAWWEEAQTHFSVAVGEQPMEPDAWWGTGLCYAVTGAYRRAAEAFTRAHRYASVALDAGQTGSTEWMRRIPITQHTIQGGAALLAIAASELAGDRPSDDVVRDPALLECTELRILDARQAGDPVLLADALIADPAAALLGFALHPQDQRPRVLLDALRPTCEGLERRVHSLVDAWSSLREHARRADVDLPELQAVATADPSDLVAVIAGHWHTLAVAERLAADHGGDVVIDVATALRRAARDDEPATRVAALITQIERNLLPSTARATLLPAQCLDWAGHLVRGPDGTVGYPTHDVWRSLPSTRDDRWLRAELGKPVMAPATLAAWLLGKLPPNYQERPGTITGEQLARCLLDAGVPTTKAYPKGRFGRRREVDWGWPVKGEFTSEAWYLMPDGHTRIRHRVEEQTLPPSYRYTAEALAQMRKSLERFR